MPLSRIAIASLALRRQEDRVIDVLVEHAALQALLGAARLQAEHVDRALQLRELEADQLTAAKGDGRLFAVEDDIVGLRGDGLAFDVLHLQAVRERAVVVE